MIASKYLRMCFAQQKCVPRKCAVYYSSLPVPKHQQVWKKYAFRTALGLLVAGIAYDGTNEFEYCGGAGRFLRSLKIAALVSFDYAWNLYGVDETSEEYSKVGIGFLFIYLHCCGVVSPTHKRCTHTQACSYGRMRALRCYSGWVIRATLASDSCVDWRCFKINLCVWNADIGVWLCIALIAMRILTMSCSPIFYSSSSKKSTCEVLSSS